MDNEALRLLIRTKLADGHLPQNNVKWSPLIGVGLFGQALGVC